MNFNVLTEPWIYVETDDGVQKCVGLRDFFVNAHKYKKIIVQEHNLVPLEYTTTRFLIAFFMDAYRNQLRNREAIVSILEEGKFDEALIDEYIELCKTEGCTFDVFDKEKPFLQTDLASMKEIFQNKKENYKSFEEWLLASAKTVANVNPLMASGNNDIFSRRVDADKFADFAGIERAEKITDNLIRDKKKSLKVTPEDMHKLSPADYIHYVIYNHVSSQYNGVNSGNSLSVNSEAPPFFILIKGKSLFETILYNCVPFKNKDISKPLWRWDKQLDMFQKEHYSCLTSEDGILMGLIYPARFIYPFIYDEQSVTKIYYSGMLSMLANVFPKNEIRQEWWEKTKEAWAVQKEPHVSYRYTEEKIKDKKTKREIIKIKHKSYTMDSSNESWLDLCSYINTFGTKTKSTKTLMNFNDIAEEFGTSLKDVTIVTYYTEMKKASYLSAGKFEYEFSRDFLSNETKHKEMENMADLIKSFADTLAYYFNSCMAETKCANSEKINLGKEKYGKVLKSNFYAKSKIYYLDTYLKELATSKDSQDIEMVRKNACEHFIELAMEEYKSQKVCDKALLSYVNYKRILYLALRKKGGLKKDE